MNQPPTSATAAGLVLALGCALATGIAAYRFLSGKPRAPRLMQSTAAAGLAFQVIHVLEHVLQLAVWTVRPESKPWLSPWAASTADSLQFFCSLVPSSDAPASLGVEALHLTGNVIFLGALTAWQISMRSEQRTIASLRIAERVQLFHVFEHIVLVTTLLVFDRALGLSTAFGTAEGTALVALRVWFHYSINAVATAYALLAARSMWGTRLTPSKAVAPIPAGA